VVQASLKNPHLPAFVLVIFSNPFIKPFIMGERQYFVSIMASLTRTLYIGVTSNLLKRLYQHQNSLLKGFTQKYEIDRLVYFEKYSTAIEAITREKQLKGWLRSKKVHLIESKNPEWKDLSLDFGDGIAVGWCAPGRPPDPSPAKADSRMTEPEAIA
jgi:putative endonuclease